ncbi:DUF3152 domain-containing protein [Corynebacterium epidermidicanis]|uniref:Putative DUF3152 family protein n=1 Tax=Corynebacterium epidermidicanis TaxID=1050174 RepID=A0A0G3GMV1_9CORY|nr:DUF3152 domain-containing protein [Corynebacterium epidermidicanis]AKK02556.1 putative DUF3152 family protein [Corynebacterium epidermidicanis]
MKKSSDPMLVRFAREYGWRAYAIPVLAVITVWILVDVFFGGPVTHNSDPAGQANSTAGQTAEQGARSAGPQPAAQEQLRLPTGELPPGGAFTAKGDGTFRVVGSPGPKVGQGQEKVFNYVIEIENGVNTALYGGDDAVAAMVDATLNNPKGWTVDPKFAFQHVAPDQNPEYRIQLTSLDTTHEHCGHDLAMETSCFTPVGNRVILNESRWVRGATTAQGDLGLYRQYLINHEVGHGLGFAAHQACGEGGALAPIMMQQTLSLNNSELFRIDPNEVYQDDNKTCSFNPWPYPYGRL